MIAGILLFLALPLALAGVVHALRRWGTVSGLLGVGTALTLGIAIVVLPLGRTVELWGRQITMGGTVSFRGRALVLEDVDRIAIAFLYLTAAGIFLLAWRMSPGAMLFSVGFGLLSLLSGSLLILPLIYAGLLVEVAIALSIIALQTEGRSPTKGGLRYLSFGMLALPGLLVIHWLMDRYALTPDNTGLLDASAILLASSFALLLGSVPFYMWVPAVAGDSEPLAGAFVFTVNHGAIWFLLLAFLETYPDLSAYPDFAPIVSSAGLAMVVVGGLLAASQRRLGRLIGYGALVDSGMALIALSLKSEQGLALAMLSLLTRPFGLALMAAGLKGLRARSGGSDKLESLRGLGRRAPWSTLALLVGSLSTAGLPISPGFAARWSLYRVLASSDLATVVFSILASGGLMIGVWRALSALLIRPQPFDGVAEEGEPRASPEGWLTAAVIGVAVAACFVVGVFPQLVVPTATRVAGLYSFLTR